MFAFGTHPSFVVLRDVAWFFLVLSFSIVSGCGSGSTPSQAIGPSFQLTVTAPAAGTGTITSNPPGIDCPPTCSASFPQTAQISLSATPTGSYYFAGWSGGCSGMGGCKPKNSDGKTISAIFKRGEILSVKLSGTGTGTILSNPLGINCPTQCSAIFPPNTEVTLSENPATSDIFSSWSGACAGNASCSITLDSAVSVAAIFSTASTTQPANVIAYVFTPDGATYTAPEFALMSNGELQSVNQPLQAELMAGTEFGLVADATTSASQSAPNLQSYAVLSNGTLQPKGAPQPFAFDKFASLASDSTYVYAASDEGIFAYQDRTTGLTPLPAIEPNPVPPSPCTVAEENAGQCFYSAWLTLSSANAFLVHSSTTAAGASSYQLSIFNRSQGELSSETPSIAWNYIEAAPTPNGRFIYGIDAFNTGRIFRLDLGGNGTVVWNVLSSGKPVSDGFVQLLMSPSGLFLFAFVSDGNESPRVRVFSIDASGDLTEIPGSPFLTGQYYFSSAALDPTGQFLLLVDTSCDSSSGPCLSGGELVSMSIDSTTGALTVISDVPDGTQPYSVYALPISE
ncbi:MAG: hypothetical protein WA252_10415 [Candidatus Sulfotelmatobacter sp.]